MCTIIIMCLSVHHLAVSGNAHNSLTSVYFSHILHTYACKHCLTTGMCNMFFMDKVLPSISQTDYGQLVNILITFEPHDIFRSYFTC